MVIVLRKDGKAIQLANGRHPDEEAMEQYSMGCLAEPQVASFEEHLLVCESCQARLAHEDALRQSVRDAAPLLESRPAAAWGGRLKFAWAAGFLIVFLAVFAGIEERNLRRSNDAPAVILLHATRGAADPSSAAPFGKPLTLVLDLTDLPSFPGYPVEIVDAGGHPAFASNAAPRNSQLRSTLTRGLAAGEYFVRVYNPARELLREYALALK